MTLRQCAGKLRQAVDRAGERRPLARGLGVCPGVELVRELAQPFRSGPIRAWAHRALPLFLELSHRYSRDWAVRGPVTSAVDVRIVLVTPREVCQALLIVQPMTGHRSIDPDVAFAVYLSRFAVQPLAN